MLRRDPAHWRHARTPGGSVQGYRPGCVAFFRPPSCQHRSRESLPAQLSAHSASRESQQSGLFFTVFGSHRIAQCIVECRPHSGLLPVRKVVPDHSPRRKIAGQHAPGASALHQVEDCVEHLPFRVLHWSPALARQRNEWLQDRPLCVSQITGISNFFIGYHPELLIAR